MYCGDAIAVTLTPQQLSPHSFEITYVVTAADSPEKVLAKALTRHVLHKSNGARSSASNAGAKPLAKR